MMPVELAANNKTGIPHPIKKARLRLRLRPMKKLNQRLILLSGWETSSSMNSAELYIYIDAKMMLTSGTIMSTTFIRLSKPLEGLSFKLKRLNPSKMRKII